MKRMATLTFCSVVLTACAGFAAEPWRELARLGVKSPTSQEAQALTVEAERQLAEADRRSDEALQRALPAIKEWEAKGKPYIPWARELEDLPQARIPAFPGAEGGGMYSFGGRGGKVIVVTSLEDSGPGTFREACEAGGPRIIVFNVAGIIRLKERIRIRAPYITIAGQTAPGDGVCITGETVEVDTHDVVIRHMRFRRGETNVFSRNDSLGGNPVGNVIIDHVSASWGLDENLSIYRHMYDAGEGRRVRMPTVNVTVQWSISSEALDTYNHSFGATWGGDNNLFHHNLFACNTGRNPSMSASAINLVNNVLFNWEHRTADGGAGRVNLINNYYKPGPTTPKETIAFRIGKVELSPERADGRGRMAQWYVSGNYVDGHEKVTADNWAGGVQFEDEVINAPNSIGADALLAKVRVNQPHVMWPVKIHPAQQAYELVLANAGATLPRRDAVDQRVIQMVRSGVATYKNGIITDPSQVGGYPQYSGQPYVDRDSDGMPDEWETKNGLDPKDAADASADSNGDGYTNIEKYINGLDPAQKIDWTDPQNNTDRLISAAK